jgi:tetratricopeptide (TPR) repeat protein
MQDWIYRSFQHQTDADLRLALLRIAAFSTERLPLPERLLPAATEEWPVSFRLGEARHELAALGLTPLSSDGEKYWAMIHDILGRPLGEDFAATIFKIDSDHGHAGFVNIWREVLGALDSMPAPLRDTSRLFRHHTAISRRRVAKLDENLYGVSLSDKNELLLAAIRDLIYAFTQIPFTPGTESNLNLLNSLARAYFDLADLADKMGKGRDAVRKIQALANEATKSAYQESPTNPFVIERYVRNLLRSARDNPERTLEYCVDILGIVFSALSSNDPEYRTPQLNNLAEQAFQLLLQQAPTGAASRDPQNAVEVLVDAWRALAENDQLRSGSLAGIPEGSRERALKILGHPVAAGNVQALRLRYNLIAVGKPFAFTEQIKLLDQLDARRASTPPQLRLEYGILLFQTGRYLEGDKVFKELRKLWKESEHVVEVPDRLRWLRSADGRSLQIVHARVQADYGARVMARVQEFGSIPVPLRPEEHGFRELRVGSAFAGHASFGPKGPFLRPLTAGARG